MLPFANGNQQTGVLALPFSNSCFQDCKEVYHTFYTPNTALHQPILPVLTFPTLPGLTNSSTHSHYITHLVLETCTYPLGLRGEAHCRGGAIPPRESPAALSLLGAVVPTTQSLGTGVIAGLVFPCSSARVRLGQVRGCEGGSE